VEAAVVAAQHADSWQNAITGLGTTIDPLTRAMNVPTRQAWQNSQTLETLYYEDDLCAKIVDKPIDAAMRQSWTPELPSADNEASDVKERAERISRRARELKVDELIVEAKRWGRLYGGGAILPILGPESGDVSLPRNQNARPRIQALTVFERDELMPARWYSSPLDPEYGRAASWYIYPKALGTAEDIRSIGGSVHTSRLLKFEGLPASKMERQRQNGWSPTVLTRVIDVIRDAQQNWRSVSLILQQSHQAVFALKGLVNMVANGQGALLQRRMEIVNMARSISRAVLIDAEGEKFDYHSANLSGLDVILDKTWQRVAAAADMPVTVLMGMSPAGLNATGASDTRQWYDTVQSMREQELGPQLERLLRLIAADVGDPEPAEWVVRWPSLWQMSPTEEAAYRKSVADTDAVYIDRGVVTPEEITVSRFGGGAYSAETVVDLDLRAAVAKPAEPGDEAKAYPAKPAPVAEPVPPEAT
jgi:phage-related protein (TIGR01555 family)